LRQQELQSGGVRLIAVVKEELGVEPFREFFPHEIFLDTDRAFNAALGSRLLTWRDLLTPSFVKQYLFAKKSVTGDGKGEGLLAGGILVIGPGESGVKYVHREEPDQPPNFDEIVEAALSAAV
jgi:hypothetical protein